MGGSTLTQQLVKNVYAGQYVEHPTARSSTSSRRGRSGEGARGAACGQGRAESYTKDQILAKYLNTVYFGHGAYGAEAAAQTFFGKHASELTVLESATLSPVVQARLLRPDR